MKHGEAASGDRDNTKKMAVKKTGAMARNTDSLTRQNEALMIVPPGLISYMFLFEAHASASTGKPIAIVGDTGVGKSLLVRVFKNLYLEQGGDPEKFIIVNCSHFDKELARSELFGHEKGAFTGANQRKDGWIEIADGGVLVLDEIGELSEDNQAKLLTVIEDGKYHTVGGTKIKEVKNLQIVGLTNRSEWEMRHDFWQRLFPFYIPPLHQRRSDSLYHLAADFPDLISKLTFWQVLSILAYHWPGNVRELQRVELFNQRFTKYLELYPVWRGKLGPTLTIDRKDKSLEFMPTDALYQGLKDHGADVDTLESILNHFGVGLNSSNFKKAFPKFNIKQMIQASDPHFQDIYRSWERRHNTIIQRNFEAFENAYTGYELFCSLFFRDPKANSDNLIIEARGLVDNVPFYLVPERFKPSFMKLMKSVFEYLSGIKLPRGQNVPLEVKERKSFLQKWFRLEPSNKFLASLVGENVAERQDAEMQPDIFKMTETDFNKYYYGELLKLYGTVRAVAKVLGMNESTLYGRYRRISSK